MQITNINTSGKTNVTGDFEIEVSFSDIQAVTELRVVSTDALISASPSGLQLSASVDASGNLTIKYFNGNAWATL
jgi:hypothetical protein